MSRERPSVRHEDRRRTVAAIVIAIVLHLAIGAWTLRQPRRDEPVLLPPRITLDLRYAAPRPATPNPPFPPDATTEPRSTPPKPTRLTAKRSPTPTDATPPDTHAGTRASKISNSEVEPLRPKDGRAAHEAPATGGEGAPGGGTEGVDVFSHDGLDRALSGWREQPRGGVGIDGPGGDAYGEGTEGERRRVTARVERDIERGQAENRVRSGHFDPYFRELGRGVEGIWRPDLGHLVDGGLGGLAKALGHTLFDAAGRYGASGNPFPDPDTAPIATARAPEGAGLIGRRFDTLGLTQLWNQGDLSKPLLVAVLELNQRPDGTPISIELLTSSGFATYDRDARDSLWRIAAESLAPAHGLGLGGERIRTVWRLETKVVAQMPGAVPDLAQGPAGGGFSGLVYGTVFDDTTGETAGPIRFLSKAVLVAVYGGETLPVGLSPEPDASPEEGAPSR